MQIESQYGHYKIHYHPEVHEVYRIDREIYLFDFDHRDEYLLGKYYNVDDTKYVLGFFRRIVIEHTDLFRFPQPGNADLCATVFHPGEYGGTTADQDGFWGTYHGADVEVNIGEAEITYDQTDFEHDIHTTIRDLMADVADYEILDD